MSLYNADPLSTIDKPRPLGGNETVKKKAKLYERDAIASRGNLGRGDGGDDGGDTVIYGPTGTIEGVKPAPEDSEETFDPKETSHSEIRLPDMQGLGTDYAHQNKWVAYVPLENVLGRSYNNLQLNLTRFTIPQIQVGSTQQSYKGYSYNFPTHVIQPDTKEMTFEYIVDENWYNYKALYTFCSQTGNFNPVDDSSITGTAEAYKSNFIDVRVWLINHYKKRVLDFLFHDCWIHMFADLALDYSSTEEVHHSFSFYYSTFELTLPASGQAQ